jgi:hypothetical protein
MYGQHETGNQPFPTVMYAGLLMFQGQSAVLSSFPVKHNNNNVVRNSGH